MTESCWWKSVPNFCIFIIYYFIIVLYFFCAVNSDIRKLQNLYFSNLQIKIIEIIWTNLEKMIFGPHFNTKIKWPNFCIFIIYYIYLFINCFSLIYILLYFFLHCK